ncbi:glycosyltransferase [Azohydromonas lata]|uniref:Glycosyltransferase n=1 Tax=Azohydromonas lata TaxID=45677 RepID=A0ABU5IN50_9BURK|nr:glycosyltransferase [Azohydromonas lata]MDZ5460320.1 glycosyltransferase [Azohydromonas lata]
MSNQDSGILARANRAMQQGNYQIAIALYEECISKNVKMAKTVEFNLHLAKKRLHYANGTRPMDGRRAGRHMATRNKLAAATSSITSIDVTEATAFDRAFYLRHNLDVMQAGVDPESHYFASGESEGRRPNCHFDPHFYLRIHADVRRAGISPFRHFIESGFHEGRVGHSPIEDVKRSSALKPLLFVGHDGIQAGSEIVLLEVIKWFFNHTTRRIKLLLLDVGPVVNQYAKYCDVYSLAGENIDNPKALVEFLSDDFEFAYLNTVVTGIFPSMLKQYGVKLQAPIVVHIHEMEKVLAQFESRMQTLLGHTRAWISASPSSTATLIGKYGIPKNTVCTVSAFINPVVERKASSNLLRRDARKFLGLSTDSFVVAACGTMYWRKGVDIFVDTARLLMTKTQRSVEFVWLGDGPDRAELEASLTPEEKKFIKFAGNQPNANKLLAAADVFFLSSREDPFPLVVLEAAQHGVPSVCFEKATGITEFVRKDAGITVRDIDYAGAAVALLKFLDRPELVQQMGQTAKNRLFDGYTATRQNLKIFDALIRHAGYRPALSIIVPFYNHERYVAERLLSIFNQSIKDVEVILLDDCSTDHTLAAMKPFQKSERVRLVENSKNSGSPFKQWKKGVQLASADVVWIAEGDDSCEHSFIETLLPYFDDPLVNIAAAKTEIIDEKGEVKVGALNGYFEMAAPEKFERSYVKDGFTEVVEQFGAVCTLVNGSGLLIRKSALEPQLPAADQFKMCGDWRIYLGCLTQGKIAYDVSTKNYFRRHSASQVHKVEGTETYFAERQIVAEYVVENFSVTPRLLKRMLDAIFHEWDRFKFKHEGKQLSDIFDKNAILSKATLLRDSKHVGFYVHGMTFSTGGIERLAAQLSNHLVSKGWRVTIYCRTHERAEPVYPLYESVRVVPIFHEADTEVSVQKLRRELLNSDIDVFVPMLSEWLFDPVVEAARHTGVPVIASEHNDPWKIEEQWWSHDARVACFEKVDYIHLLLNRFKDSLPSQLQSKVAVISNGVHVPHTLPAKQKENLIVAVGRLEPQKRFDRLIDGVAIRQDVIRGLGFRVEIYGHGSLECELLQKIKAAGVSDLIQIMGVCRNMEAVYSRAKVLAHPASFEGFGIVVVEALANGTPVVAFQECNGPNEIIRDGIDGKLVDTLEEFGDALIQLAAASNEEFQKIQKSAHLRARDYSVEKFNNSWKELLSQVVQN